jgi:hypothetical protein
LNGIEFSPQVRRGVFAEGYVIVRDGFPMLVATREKPTRHFGVELANRHLNVDDVLGTEAGDGCRADVIDAQGQRVENLLERLSQALELVGPRRVVVMNDDHRLVIA